MTRAKSTRQINSALSKAEGRSAFAEFHRLESKVSREEALAEAYDRMDGRDPDAEELERQFAQLQRSEQLQRELSVLRQEVVTADPQE